MSSCPSDLIRLKFLNEINLQTDNLSLGTIKFKLCCTPCYLLVIASNPMSFLFSLKHRLSIYRISKNIVIRGSCSFSLYKADRVLAENKRNFRTPQNKTGKRVEFFWSQIRDCDGCRWNKVWKHDKPHSKLGFWFGMQRNVEGLDGASMHGKRLTEGSNLNNIFKVFDGSCYIICGFHAKGNIFEILWRTTHVCNHGVVLFFSMN